MVGPQNDRAGQGYVGRRHISRTIEAVAISVLFFLTQRRPWRIIQRRGVGRQVETE